MWCGTMEGFCGMSLGAQAVWCSREGQGTCTACGQKAGDLKPFASQIDLLCWCKLCYFQ